MESWEGLEGSEAEDMVPYALYQDVTNEGQRGQRTRPYSTIGWMVVTAGVEERQGEGGECHRSQPRSVPA